MEYRQKASDKMSAHRPKRPFQISSLWKWSCMWWEKYNDGSLTLKDFSLSELYSPTQSISLYSWFSRSIRSLLVSGLSKVAGCRRKSSPAWWVSAGYSAWYFFMDGVFQIKYLGLAAYFDNLAVYFKTFWQPWVSFFFFSLSIFFGRAQTTLSQAFRGQCTYLKSL